MMLPSITLNHEQLSNFQDAIQKEWIITNGLGGYASSTVLGINTRKYHGLLVAAFHPPENRRICLAKLDEEIIIGNNTYPLNANEFQNGIFPQGHRFLKEFSLSPSPKFTYSLEGISIQKTIFMPHEKNAVITIYNISNKSSSDASIRIFPLLNWRHIHQVTDRWKISWEFFQEKENKGVDVRFSIPQSVLIIKATNGSYHAAERWVERLYYREEALRGESYLDDCYQLGFFEMPVKANKNENFAIIAAADENEQNAMKIFAEIPIAAYDIEALREREMKRHEELLTKFYEDHRDIPLLDWLKWIVLATDTFIVKGISDVQRTVVAGYHWFEAWGRDAFISMPGLMLVTGRFEGAKKVFLTFRKGCKQGLIPNFISDQTGQPVYNAVDVSLWYANAVLQFLKYTGDFKFVQEQLWETLKTAIEYYAKGTEFNIHVDTDGLLSHGSQLTWMDAAIEGQAVTPRAGKAVEVQALWYNALRTMELLANGFREKTLAETYAGMAEKTRKSFNEKFWNLERNCLFDNISEGGSDSSLRPNQIIAVALNFTMLDNAKSENVVDVVYHELLTPYGLRTLARSDPKYLGVYAGDRRNRDKAYHNGTVWPWLLGAFTTAFLKTKGYSEYRREHALKNFLLPLFIEQTFKTGLGTLSEIFDGEPPHTPRGCISQAWSVAEPFRAYIEDVMQTRPKYEKEVLKGLS